MSRSTTEHLRAQRVIPGGVNSPVRAFKSVGGDPCVVRSASGCRIIDVDGREFIDLIGSWGAAIAGHAHPQVVEATTRALHDGLSFGLHSRRETELAEAIVRRVPSMERVRMVNSGTEAVMSALRVARAATGRTKVVKFSGCYHGHSDMLLVRAGSGAATLNLPDSPGVTHGAVGDTLLAEYNNADSVRELFARHPHAIAAIVVEPVAGNMGLVPPEDGFLASLRTIADEYGSLLIFDEVMTGLRVSPGGAQERYGVRPDLTTLGKIIGGGLPVGAYGGRADLMNLVAPLGPVYQAGTFSGNPVTMAAGLATLNLLDAAAYAQLELVSARLERGLRDALHTHGQRGVVQRVGSMVSVFFGVDRVRNMHDAASANHDAFARSFRGLFARGVLLPPSGYESWFVSLAHTPAIIDQTVEAFSQTLAALAIADTLSDISTAASSLNPR